MPRSGARSFGGLAARRPGRAGAVSKPGAELGMRLLALVGLLSCALPVAAKGDEEPAALRGFLAAHNRLRARHCAPPLIWSKDLAKVAGRWADQLRGHGCALEHSHGKYGENLAAATRGALTNEAVVELWYAEKEKYRRPGFSMTTGHFTQLVWVGTKRLGCAVASCKDIDVWVCEYDPPGNVEGGYRANVLPESCRR